MRKSLYFNVFVIIMLTLIIFTNTSNMANQKVRVNFFRNEKGKWLSVLNLKASFAVPDTVDVDSRPAVDVDFDDDENEKDITVIVITPLPLLEVLQTPKPQKVVQLTTPLFTELSTVAPTLSHLTVPQPITASSSTVKSEATTSAEISTMITTTAQKLHTTEEAPDYPVNDLIPGILDLGIIIIPHKLRHHGHHHTTETMRPTTVMPVFETGQAEVTSDASTSGYPLIDGPVDDEDYNVGGSTIDFTEPPEASGFPSTATELATSMLSESSQTPLSELTEPPDKGEDDDYVFNADYFDSNSTFNDTLNTDIFSNTEMTDNDTFVLTAREVLHTDSLGRNESVLRDLLSNLTYLEYEEDFSSYYRDHGASFLIPVLKAVNYDNSSVPVAFSDIPLNVKVKLNVIHLANFDSEQMEYTIDLEMEMRWFDIRLANNYSKPIRIREKQVLDMVFRPDPYFVNSKYSYFHMVSFPNFRMRILPTGLVIYTMRVTLLPSCSMTFCRFPHDSQECDLLISSSKESPNKRNFNFNQPILSVAYPQTFVNLMWHDEPIQFSSRISLPELKIKSMSTEDCIVEGKLIASSCLRLLFKLERDGARYIVEKYIPSTLAMMFAWVAPYVPYNYEDVRIITPITVLLTLVQMEKGDIKVRTSYLTSMDMWFAAMKAFSVLSLIESLIVLALIKRSRAMEKQAHRATNQYSKELFDAEKRRLTDLYHRLDTASRFLSPIVFVVFFVVYVLYIAQGDESYCLNKNNL